MDSSPSLSHLPDPNPKRIALHISPPAERALRQGHPWIFDKAITRQSHTGSPGDLAVIFDDKNRFMAVGLYDPTSPIRVRILQSRQPAAINADWFKTRLEAAASLRLLLNEQPAERATTGYRFVHGENDGLPGLVIDRYDRTLVIKLYTSAWIPHLKEFCSALAKVSLHERLILRLSRSLMLQTEFLAGLKNGQVLSGPPITEPILFQENGLLFEVDPILGQKTGFFLDQRENRARVELLSKDRSILNVFAYTGGFSVYSARGGARQVVSVDISAPAMQNAIRNMALNRHIPNVAAASHETVTEDAFAILTRFGKAKRRFDMLIIDPPMFAHNQNQIAEAIQAYQRLTRLGLGVLLPGGVLVQSSCSSRIGAETFIKSIHQAARGCNRCLKEIERTGHALDHPIGFKEGSYLKCLFARAQ